jgi:hypothetical protein
VFFIRRPGQSSTEFIDALVGPGLGLIDLDMVSPVQGADSLDLVELMAEIKAARVRRIGWREDPMYDPQLDERSWP